MSHFDNYLKTEFILVRRTSVRFIFIILLPLFCVPIFAVAQNLPKEIRGYKVYKAKIAVKNKSEKPGAPENQSGEKDKAAFIKVGEPQITGVSLTGVTLELSAEIEAVGQSGTIDFISFKDFRVNDLAVTPEEYIESFPFEKNRTIVLPKPIKIFLGTLDALRGALGEIKNAKDEWTVTGTVFVFGKFKKFGFGFKRVVPVEINLKIKNPLKNTEPKTVSTATNR